jgi:uncharacterized protein YjbI with pentapeptide repeats
MYKILKGGIENKEYGVVRTNKDGTVSSFIFDPANTDYANFKKEVLAGAELQDADGNVMTQEQANQFVASLP